MTTLDLTPDELLTTTRTVRKRLDLDRPVPLQLIEECIEVALQAPSGSNRQDWQWLVVTDPVKRKFLGDIYGRLVEQYLDSAHSATRQFEGDPERATVQQRVGTSVAWLGQHMAEVPVLVIPCLRTGPLPAGNQAGIWGSLLPGVWSYVLAARARGLGTAWTTMHLIHEREISEYFGIPEGVSQGALIPTAFYTGDTLRPAPRQPIDEVLHVDQW